MNAMSENEIGKALLRGEDPIDLDALTLRVLRRDRRRMWILGIGCVIAWMLVVMLPWSTVLPMVARVVQHQTEIQPSTAPFRADREETIRVLQIVKKGTIATFLGSIASMFLAAVCTVLLIILSRRATLRQVNVRLAEISAQLRAARK